MSDDYKPMHGVWTSRWMFILAATGSAVGLGNIWKFPYITGVNGGGAFVLVYLACVALVGIPIMVAEVLIGRRGGLSPIHSMEKLAKDSGVSRRWGWLGLMGALAGFMILSFYSIIAGWALYYVYLMVRGVFVHASPDLVQNVFNGMLASPWVLIGVHTLFMLMTMVVVAHGVKDGLERAVRIMMPALFLLLVILLGYALTTGHFMDGVRFLFRPDFHKLTGKGVLVAMGHSFFTLSLGMGAMMAYGAYMPKQVVNPKTGQAKPVSIGSTVLTVAVLDTLVALAAGLAIFPVVFANGLTAGSGPGLMFVTLPIAFGKMSMGMLFGTLFFVLVVFAAWSSSISLAEPAVAWMVENGMRRGTAAALIGGGAWLLGVGNALSFNIWESHTLFGKNMFGIMDFLTTNIMLPLGGFLIAVFAGWVMRETHVRKELGMKNFRVYLVWRAVVRIVAPAAVLIVFAHSLGWF